MAGESTTTTISDAIRSEWIAPALGAAAKERAVAAQYCKRFDLAGRGTGKLQLATEVKDDATSLNVASETTDLSNTAFDTTSVTLSPGEYGLKRFLTDSALEDNIFGPDGFFQMVVESGAEDMAIAIDDDVIALLSGFSNVVGTSGGALTLSDMAEAMSELAGNEMPAPHGAAYIVSKQQAKDYNDALVTANGTVLANYHTKPESNNGLDGYHGTWMNAEIRSTSLVDTANAGADDAGALFVRGDGNRNPRSAALVLAVSREVTVKPQYQPSKRGWEVVISQRKGAVEWHDKSGVGIQTRTG